MPKVTLGKRPETITLPAKFEHLDGTKDSIKVTYRYRTKTEFAAFIDERAAAAKAAAEQEPVVADPTEFSLAEFFSKQDESLVDHILEIATGWDLADPLNRETVTQLVEEYPAAAAAIAATYRAACVEGRRGN